MLCSSESVLMTRSKKTNGRDVRKLNIPFLTFFNEDGQHLIDLKTTMMGIRFNILGCFK